MLNVRMGAEIMTRNKDAAIIAEVRKEYRAILWRIKEKEIRQKRIMRESKSTLVVA